MSYGDSVVFDGAELNLNNTIEDGPEDFMAVADYDSLINKPKINGVELEGNKTLENLGLDLSNYVQAYEEDRYNGLHFCRIRTAPGETVLELEAYSQVIGEIPHSGKIYLYDGYLTISVGEDIPGGDYLQAVEIHDLVDPVTDYMPAHKKYVDDSVSNVLEGANLFFIVYADLDNGTVETNRLDILEQFEEHGKIPVLWAATEIGAIFAYISTIAEDYIDFVHQSTIYRVSGVNSVEVV